MTSRNRQHRYGVKRKRGHGRHAGTTNVVVSVLTPEQLAERRADQPAQAWRPLWATLPTTKEAAATHRALEQRERDDLALLLQEPVDLGIGVEVVTA